MLSFFPLDVLDEIWDVIESVSEGFLTYSLIQIKLLHLPLSVCYRVYPQGLSDLIVILKSKKNYMLQS